MNARAALATTESPQIERVRQARAGLLLTHPFFGVLSLKMMLRETDSIPTAGVDSKYLHFNPAFIDTLSNAELKGVIAHEVLHLALGHHARMGARDHTMWNVACDYALNPTLVSDGFTLPKGALIDPQYTGLMAEVIYERLKQQAQQQPAQGKGKGKPGQGTPQPGQGWGDFTSPGPEDSADAKESLREWQDNAADAMKAAQSAGKMPAGIKREIDSALAPKADWKALLRRFMTDQVRSTPTWSKPNKRFFPALYLPGKLKDGMGAIAIMVDTSGSIDSATLGVFAGEINAIIADCAPAMVHVIYCDADVNHVDSYDAGEEVTLRPHGGGGTDFRPAFEYADKESWPLACAVYLTDMCGTFPTHAPEYAVLWAAYGASGITAPWGETVKIDG